MLAQIIERAAKLKAGPAKKPTGPTGTSASRKAPRKKPAAGRSPAKTRARKRG
jgi:hypothetical protein